MGRCWAARRSSSARRWPSRARPRSCSWASRPSSLVCRSWVRIGRIGPMAIDGTATTIEVTPEAATKLQELRADDPKRAFLRLYVAGRSCCSFMYGLAFDENAEETDAVTQAAGLKVAIDAQSLPYCDGAKVEWVDGPEGTGFLVRNPSLGGSCACGG
ncbi:MAG: iron-sulfur cluster assembly accessory protein [Chloroflexi bacterium]|nr:MAG: iron-sulfur cluster assembly accessory protein [Chloroflexota bacterium]